MTKIIHMITLIIVLLLITWFNSNTYISGGGRGIMGSDNHRKDRDKDRKEQLDPIVLPDIYQNDYTERYLAMYYLNVIQQELMILERHITGSNNTEILELPDPQGTLVPSDINQINNKLPSPITYTKLPIKNIRAIKSLSFIPDLFKRLNYTLSHKTELNKWNNDAISNNPCKINPNKRQVFTVNTYYTAIAGDYTYYRFPLIKGKCYNVRYFYSSNVDYESQFKANIFIIFKNGQLYTLGVEGFPKFPMYQGYRESIKDAQLFNKTTTDGSLNNTSTWPTDSNDIYQEFDQDQPFTKSLDRNTDNIIKHLLNNRIDYRLEKCFFKSSDTIFPTVLHSIKQKQDCIRLNGVWDKPCTDDTECQYYKLDKRGSCNKLTGYCNLPKGMKHLSYHLALPESQPLCADCPIKGEDIEPDYTCCYQDKQPKYIW